MLVAVAIVTAAFGVLFHMAASGQRVARAQPEAADLQQRLRVAVDMMQRDLLAAGAGLTYGNGAGPLINYFPPIVPARTGARRADAELSYFEDRISIVYVPHAAASAPLSANMATTTSEVLIDTGDPGCPVAGLCGFVDGTRALILDPTEVGKGFDLFSVTDVATGLVHDAPNPPFSRAYPAGTVRVVPVKHQVYYLDRVNRRLMLYDGFQSDVPLVDNIVDLSFTYFIDPSPLSAPRPPDGAGNCLYAAGSPPVPLLADLGGVALRPVTSAQLTDGPECGIAPARFDGDLLRVRRVRVTIRAQVGSDDLRGAGADFSRRGVSSHGESYIPDFEITFDVTPRNVYPTR
jgi:hypothetical protein